MVVLPGHDHDGHDHGRVYIYESPTHSGTWTEGKQEVHAPVRSSAMQASYHGMHSAPVVASDRRGYDVARERGPRTSWTKLISSMATT
jgi:hypothetical protein